MPSSRGFTLAVLADIHANLTALDAVLRDTKQFNVAGIIAAGDHIGDGPQPAEVLRRLRELDACLIRGNREDYLLNYDAGLLPAWDTALQWSAMVWTYQRLDRETLSFLSDLPPRTQDGSKASDCLGWHAAALSRNIGRGVGLAKLGFPLPPISRGKG